MDNFIDFYDVLQVPFHASEEQIRAAYQKRKGEIHPNFSGARDEYYLVNTAYEILSNPVSRAEYDQIYRGYYHKKYNASHASHTFDQNVHHQAEFQSAPTYSYPPRRRNGWKYTSFISIELNIVLIIMIANGLYNSLYKISEITAFEEELFDTYVNMTHLT